MDFFGVRCCLEIPQHPVHVICDLDCLLSVLILFVQLDETEDLLLNVHGVLMKHPGTVLRLSADHDKVTACFL